MIMPEIGSQQGDTEDVTLSAETKQRLVEQKLELKINIRYLDDGNPADTYKIVLLDHVNKLKLVLKKL